jgi:hypothetical protein
VLLRPDEVRTAFDTPNQALEKLLALAMAVGNNRAKFQRIVAR